MKPRVPAAAAWSDDRHALVRALDWAPPSAAFENVVEAWHDNADPQEVWEQP